MRSKVIGYVKNIEYEPHAESTWEILFEGSEKTLFLTDQAFTPSDYEKWLGQKIAFQVTLQIADLKPSKSREVEVRSVHGGFLSFIRGRVHSIIDQDEFLLNSEFEILIENDEQIPVKPGDTLEGEGELRIEVDSVEILK